MKVLELGSSMIISFPVQRPSFIMLASASPFIHATIQQLGSETCATDILMSLDALDSCQNTAQHVDIWALLHSTCDGPV